MTADWMNCVSADQITAAATVTIALTGIGALLYAILQLNQSHKSEKIRHLIEFVREFESEPMTGYRRAVADKRLKSVEYPSDAQKLLDFFETIGRIVRRGYLDKEDVEHFWMLGVYHLCEKKRGGQTSAHRERGLRNFGRRKQKPRQGHR